jgi:hypothetical protein
MADRKHIRYPTPGSRVRVQGFPTYGCVTPDVKRVRIAFLDQRNKPVGTVTQLRRVDPADKCFWSWLVTDIPADGPYRLQLIDDEDGSLIDEVKDLTAVRNDQTAGPEAETTDPQKRNTKILSPVAMQTVPRTFTASGSTDQSSGVSARMSRNGSNPVTQPATISNKVWSAVFTSVEAHNDWKLDALEGTTVTDSKEPIIVQ